MTQRYGSQFFCSYELKVSVQLSGPQNADQIPEGVRQALDLPHVQQVVLLKKVDGRECGIAYNKILEEAVDGDDKKG